jgi:hypothetical protein
MRISNEEKDNLVLAQSSEESEEDNEHKDPGSEEALEESILAELLEDQGEDKEDRNYGFFDYDEDNDDSLESNEDPFVFPSNNPTQTLDATTALPRMEAQMLD